MPYGKDTTQPPTAGAVPYNSAQPPTAGAVPYQAPPATTLKTKKKQGILSKFVESVAKPVTKVASGFIGYQEASARLVIGAITGGGLSQEEINKANQALTKERSFGVLGSSRGVGIDQETGEMLSPGAHAKDVLGTGAEIASYAVGGGQGVVAGKTILQGGKLTFRQLLTQGAKAGAIAGAEGGALAGGGVALQEDKSFKQTLVDTATGALVGGVLGGFGGALGAKLQQRFGKATQAFAEAREAAIAKSADKLDKAVLNITQLKKPANIRRAKKALQEMNTEGVESAADLVLRTGDEIEIAALRQNEILEQSSRIRKMDEFTEVFTAGKREAQQNYVNDAITDLEKLYTKEGDAQALVAVQDLKDKIINEGLSDLELNNLARTYGSEIGNKAFTKAGDPLTSVTATRKETIRKGLKTLVKEGLEDKTAFAALDSKMSKIYTLQKAMLKVEENVNGIVAKTQDRNLVEKIARKLGQGVDLATFGGPKAFIAKALFTSNIGNKTMNYLDIDKAIAKNLKTIDALTNGTDEALVNGIVKMFKKATQGGVADDIVPEGVIDDIVPEGGASNIEAQTGGIERIKDIPQEVTKNLDEMYTKAPESKKYIDDIAEKMAKKYNGTVVTASLKGKERAIEKIMKEYNGDASKLTDIARNTITLDSQESAKAAFKNILREVDVEKSGYVMPGDDVLGYIGGNIKVKTPNGLIAEVQVNSTKMLYAKMKKEEFIEMFSKEAYQKIYDEVGLDGGKGHGFYEIVRTAIKGSPEELQAVKDSLEYYPNFY